MERRSRLRFAVFALAGTAFFLSFFHRVAPAAISSELTRDFRLTSAALGTLSATYFYVYHIFARGFQDFDMGYASALAWIFFAILLLFTAVQFRLQRHWVYYESESGR